MENYLEIDFPKLSMAIILDAGDARNLANKSMDALMSGDEAKSEELLIQAKKSIQNAHKAQTEVMQYLAQNTCKGEEEILIPILFIHAQDTLMTIMSEVNMIEMMEKMYKGITKKHD